MSAPVCVRLRPISFFPFSLQPSVYHIRAIRVIRGQNFPLPPSAFSFPPTQIPPATKKKLKFPAASPIMISKASETMVRKEEQKDSTELRRKNRKTIAPQLGKNAKLTKLEKEITQWHMHPST
jgi:hypothetical protein